MEGSGCVRQCNLCNQPIHDVSDIDLKTIAQEYLNTGKCVQMNAGQVDFFQYLRGMKHAAGITAALMLSTPATAQTEEPDPIKECRVTGTLESGNKSNVLVYVYIDGKLYETQTDKTGFFSFTVPRNARIERSNIIKLNNKKCRGKNMFVKHAEIRVFKTIGCPAF